MLPISWQRFAQAWTLFWARKGISAGLSHRPRSKSSLTGPDLSTSQYKPGRNSVGTTDNSECFQEINADKKEQECQQKLL